MERGVSRGKREVCPSDQATRKGLGNLDSLACLGESGGESPKQAWQTTICQACMAVQDA